MKPPLTASKICNFLLHSYSAHLILSVSFNVVVHQMARIEIFSQPPYAAAPGFEPTSRVVLTRDLLKDALLTELLHPALEIKKCNLHNFFPDGLRREPPVVRPETTRVGAPAEFQRHEGNQILLRR